MLSVAILIMIVLYLAFDGFIGMGVFAALVFLSGAALFLRKDILKPRKRQGKQRRRQTLDLRRVKIIDLREER
jgi:hypothetical protein